MQVKSNTSKPSLSIHVGPWALGLDIRVWERYILAPWRSKVSRKHTQDHVLCAATHVRPIKPGNVPGWNNGNLTIYSRTHLTVLRTRHAKRCHIPCEHTRNLKHISVPKKWISMSCAVNNLADQSKRLKPRTRTNKGIKDGAWDGKWRITIA